MGLVSDRVYLAATFLLRFCSRATRTHCSIRHLEKIATPLFGNVEGVVKILEHHAFSHMQDMPEIPLA
jgi:hypothetical protein